MLSGEPCRRARGPRGSWWACSAPTASASRSPPTAAPSSTGLSVDNATGIVDQPRLPRFKAWTNYDNYVGVGTLDEDRPEQHRLQRSGRLRCREQPVRGPGRRHLGLFGATPHVQGQRQYTARMSGAARAERHDRDSRFLRRDQRRACLRGHRPLAADDGPAHRRRHRGAAGQLPRRGRLLRRRPDVLSGGTKIG